MGGTKLTAALSGMKRSPRHNTSREAIVEASPALIGLQAMRKLEEPRANAG